MTDKLAFKVFCLESYKTAHRWTGARTWKTFQKYGVFDYVDGVHGVLHSTGRKYIVEDIEGYIKSKQARLSVPGTESERT